MTIDDLRRENCIIFECISGSRAYGTDTPDSDTDIRGVFVQPRDRFFGLDPVVQVNDETNDVVFYEIGRFVDLLLKNNPNILEILCAPDDCIVHRDPLFEKLRPEMFLSKLCRDTFGGYAAAQVKKARGLNKKIVNPQPEKRKAPIDFCYVLDGQGSRPLTEWLDARSIPVHECGVTNVPHTRDVMALFHDGGRTPFRGIFIDENASEPRFSSVPKEVEPIAWIAFNKDAFKRHCRDHAEYWNWVKNRNESRYNTNVEHGRNYDSKNMMHTIRLLTMAHEIAQEGKVRVRRDHDREDLMAIRRGEHDYDALVERSENLITEIDAAIETSPLPDQPLKGEGEKVLIKIREAVYQGAV